MSLFLETAERRKVGEEASGQCGKGSDITLERETIHRRRNRGGPSSSPRVKSREAGVGRATPTPTLERGSIQSSCSLFWYPFRATHCPLHAQIEEATAFSLAASHPFDQTPVTGWKIIFSDPLSLATPRADLCN